MVVRSSCGGERKRVNPREEVSLTNDDLIELIPGHHFFQLVLLSSENKGENQKGSHERAAKKARKVCLFGLTKECSFLFGFFKALFW